MKKRTQSISDILAAVALAEMEGLESLHITSKISAFADQLEKRFIEIAYAEAADYEDVERSLRREMSTNPARPYECECWDDADCIAAAK